MRQKLGTLGAISMRKERDWDWTSVVANTRFIRLLHIYPRGHGHWIYECMSWRKQDDERRKKKLGYFLKFGISSSKNDNQY